MTSTQMIEAPTTQAVHLGEQLSVMAAQRILTNAADDAHNPPAGVIIEPLRLHGDCQESSTKKRKIAE